MPFILKQSSGASYLPQNEVMAFLLVHSVLMGEFSLGF